MKIGIAVNAMLSDEGGQTTYRIAAACTARGHNVHVVNSGHFAYDPDDTVCARSRQAPPRKYTSSEKYLAALKSRAAERRWINLDDLDILLLRSNPAVQTAWAQHTGIHFGRIAARRGVIVLNDPDGLSRAMNKLYLQSFPEEVRPRTLITRDKNRIKAFAKREGTVVLKPLQGSGGRNVFVVKSNDSANLNEIIRAVSRDGYVIAQEYLPAAAEGDTRLFVMNGAPLTYHGRYAAFRRIRSGDDIRSNIHAGGRLRRAKLDADTLELVERVRPKLTLDGMFLVGLDIVGSKLMEINVFCPGGLGNAQKLEKVDFTKAVVDALEKKVDCAKYYRHNFSNVDMAIL